MQSISYDVAANPNDYKSLKAIEATTPQKISPEKDTVDAILLTIRVPDDQYVDIIHSSGTHGVEGYLGSAVQIRFLHEVYLQNEALLQQGKGENNSKISDSSGRVRKILLIHFLSLQHLWALSNCLCHLAICAF